MDWIDNNGNNNIVPASVLSHFSHVQLFVTPWTVAHQAPLSLGFSRQDYWSGLPCPPPEGLSDPGIGLTSPVPHADRFLLLGHQLRVSRSVMPNSLWPYKAMAPHSSTLAWKIPWTEEPGRLQSMGSWRVGHDWANSLSLFTFMHWRRKWQPIPVLLPGESQGQGSLVGCCLWSSTESDTTEAT